MTIYGIPLEDLRILQKDIHDEPKDRRRAPQGSVWKGTVFRARRLDGERIEYWIGAQRSFHANRGASSAKKHAFESDVINALRPLQEEDARDLQIRAQVLKMVLPVGGDAAPLMVVWEDLGLIDLDAIIAGMTEHYDQIGHRPQAEDLLRIAKKAHRPNYVR